MIRLAIGLIRLSMFLTVAYPLAAPAAPAAPAPAPATAPAAPAPVLRCESLFTAPQEAATASVTPGRGGGARASEIERAWQQAISRFDNAKNYEPLLRSMLASFRKDADDATRLFDQTYSTVELAKSEKSGIRLFPRYEPQSPQKGLIIQIEAGPQDLRNPFSALLIANQLIRADGARNRMIFDKFSELNGYCSSFFRSFYDWAETHSNADRGSAISKILVELDEINSRLEIFEFATKEDAEPYFKSFDDADIAAAYAQYRAAVTPRLTALLEELRAATEQRQEALKKFKSRPTDLPQALDELVARNDRKGVADLLSSQLPWDLMEPSEKSFWNSFISSVKNPSPKKFLVYRGFGGQPQHRNADGQIYAFAPVFREGKSWSAKYQQITKMYEAIRYDLAAHQFDGARVLKTRQRKDVKDLPPNMLNLMEGGLKHLSLNFSYDPWLSFTFAHEGKKISMGAFLIDEDRLLLNLHSPYTGKDDAEREIHTPFIVFPDEVVHYIEQDYKNEKATYKKFLEDVAKATGKKVKKPEDLDETVVQKGIARFAKELGL